MEKKIRNPQVAGQFYPSDPSELRSLVASLLNEASGETGPGWEIVSLIAPHAGYVYSGAVAARGFGLLKKGQFDKVIVISPCHVDYFPFASIYDGDAYRTPLGEIRIDKTLCEKIAACSDLVMTGDRGHATGRGGRGEHSLEVQLPFLQVALGEFGLVPIVMGDQSRAVVEALGKALGSSLKGEKVLIVASTDLSHFHDQKRAKELDSVFTACLSDFDWERIVDSLASGTTEACGGGPAASALLASGILGAEKCTVLQYATSGDVSGDMTSVVGYASAAVLRRSARDVKTARESEEGPANESVDEAGLDALDRDFLLSYARNVLERAFDRKRPEMDIPPSPVLRENRGGFVTLKKAGQLRGCIGYIEAVMPLVDTVREMAKAAAFSDHRFPQVDRSELDDITIEISVLSPIRVIEDPTE
ncbi:MAG TPA: AmmeMemoRadiSam system protein B, partial [Candidatus Krumholzibacterium sp.]|nr:AmmeMemoRadiSam system protein B [Candidatus Krumholzibacterium sp.]